MKGIAAGKTPTVLRSAGTPACATAKASAIVAACYAKRLMRSQRPGSYGSKTGVVIR